MLALKQPIADEPFDPRPAVLVRPRPAAAVRDVGVDALRGLAVFTMVGAHMVRCMLDRPYPFWLRVYSSLAAPAFILLTGFMFGHSHARRPTPFARHLRRAVALLLVAALIDVALWQAQPFASFDVLYLIALVPLASHFALRDRRAVMLAVVAIIFLATPFLQQAVGYESATADSAWKRLQAWMVDGWFPVFPWLGVGILGAALGAARHDRGPQVFARSVALLGVSLFAGGLTITWLDPAEYRTSGGFAELFYPPTLGVLFAILGAELCLLALLSGRVRSSLWRGLAVYGRTALAMYIAHLVIIAFAFKPWVEPGSILTFVVAYLGHATLLWFLALAIRRCWPSPRSFWGRLLLGS